VWNTGQNKPTTSGFEEGLLLSLDYWKLQIENSNLFATDKMAVGQAIPSRIMKANIDA